MQGVPVGGERILFKMGSGDAVHLEKRAAALAAASRTPQPPPVILHPPHPLCCPADGRLYQRPILLPRRHGAGHRGRPRRDRRCGGVLYCLVHAELAGAAARHPCPTCTLLCAYACRQVPTLTCAPSFAFCVLRAAVWEQAGMQAKVPVVAVKAEPQASFTSPSPPPPTHVGWPGCWPGNLLHCLPTCLLLLLPPQTEASP